MDTAFTDHPVRGVGGVMPTEKWRFWCRMCENNGISDDLCENCTPTNFVNIEVF